MFKPDDPLQPRDDAFGEAWHAQTLAIADGFVTAGHITATQWANALGAALEDAKQSGMPDTPDTYYHAALRALEQVTVDATPLDQVDLAKRKTQWETAYHNTPHGQPVKLRP